MMKLLLVAAGGAIGSVSRFLASSFILRLAPSFSFPLGTFTVNAFGSFLIGLLWAFSDADLVSAPLRFFLFAGLLGGFTTFSSFSIETMNLFRSGQTGIALGYILTSNIVCITLSFAGFFTAKSLMAG